MATVSSSRTFLSTVRQVLCACPRSTTQPVKFSAWPSRSFSQTSHLAEATVAAPSVRQTQDPNRQPSRLRFNVGVFGAGRIARQVHMVNILGHRRLNLQWVIDDNQQCVDDTREQLYMHDTPFYSSADVDRLLSDPSLDGVFVLTSTSSHADLVCRALDKGKAVFVEKPTGETTEEIERCYALAEKMGRPLVTGFQRRFDPGFQDLYNTVLGGEAVGKVYNIRTVSRDSPKPSYEFLKHTDPSGCNLLSDMAVHDVDTIVWLTQCEEPEFIYVVTHAHDAELAVNNIADTLVVVIKYKSGVIATIDSCRETTYGYDIRLEVFGSGGKVMAENVRETTSIIDGVRGGSVTRIAHSFPQRFEKAFQLEVDHFVRCMDGTVDPMVTKAQALMTSRIVEKGVQSFREQAPVYF